MGPTSAYACVCVSLPSSLWRLSLTVCMEIAERQWCWSVLIAGARWMRLAAACIIYMVHLLALIKAPGLTLRGGSLSGVRFPGTEATILEFYDH